MSRITELFEKHQGPVLNVFCTAGFPHLDSTREVMRSLQKHGAHMIELGMPYSDPLADGPVIQSSSSRALQNGMTISKMFEQLSGMRNEIQIPVVLMGYFNPLLQYGFERFCEQAQKVGVDGLIIPDLPMVEFERKYREIVNRYHLDFIFLVSPETPEERVRKLDEYSSGFLYAVSTSALTGGKVNQQQVSNTVSRLDSMQLKNPVLVGFGIHDKTSFQSATQHAQGAIIGSAYIRAIENASDIDEATGKFLNSVLND
jgi:tryptophan synthase alpha chain